MCQSNYKKNKGLPHKIEAYANSPIKKREIDVGQ